MHAGFVHFQVARHIDRFASVTDTVQTGDPGRLGLPSLETRDIKLAVARIEPRTHRGRAESQWKLHRTALHQIAHLLFHNEIEGAFAIGSVQQLVLERAPLVARHPDLAAGGIVILAIGKPHERRLEFGDRVPMRGVHDAVEAAGSDPVQWIGRNPCPLVVAGGELAGRADPDAVRRAKSGRDDFQFLAVFGDFHQRPRVRGDALKPGAARIHRTGFCKIKIAVLVGLQVKNELVETFGRSVTIAEVLVVTGFAVVVQIVVARELVAAGSVNDIVHNFQAERLIHSGSKAAPFEILQPVVDARNNPDVAVPGAERRAFAVGEEIQPAKTHATFPRIVNRRRQAVGDISAVGSPARFQNAFGRDILRPMGGTALGKIKHHRLAFEQTGEPRQVTRIAVPDDQLEQGCRSAFRQAQHDAIADNFQPGSPRQIHSADGGHLAVRRGQARDVILGFARRALRFANRHQKRRFDFLCLEGSDESDLPVLRHTGRLFVNLRAVNRVGEHDVRPIHEKTVPMRPVVRQRTERFRTRVRELALVVRPAGQLRGAELLLAINGRVHAVFAIKRDALRLDVTARPTRRHPQQFGVEQHVRVVADADGEPFHRDVVAGKFRADARALKRKVLLQQTGAICRLSPQRAEQQTATRGEEAGRSFPWKGTSPKS